MKLLAIDTSTLIAGVGVSVDGVLRAERRHRVTTHSEALMGMVDEVLREAGVESRALDAVVCGAGPGSFTGLRIGLATAKGLCFALGRPLALVSSLEALAARAPEGSRVCAVIDAHKAEVYAGLYRIVNGLPERITDERVLPPDALARELPAHAPIVLVGEGVLRYPTLRSPGCELYDDDGSPRPTELLKLGQTRLTEGADDLGAGPRYIRASEAEIEKAKQKQ
jgi:tRNA threonylcarbamoyladenosine biosynthesis protein TsaB